MKLMKAMKKLNFWSKKKRKKKDYYYDYEKLPHYNFQHYYNPPPPPPRPPPPPQLPMPENCQCHFCHPAEPSAPPLPPWLEEGLSGNFTFANCSNDQEMGDQCISISQETVVRTAHTISSVGPTLRQGVSPSSSQLQEIVTANTSSSNSYALQQLFPSTEKAAAGGAVGLLGCVVDVGGLLFRCFFPCFHISDKALAVADHHMEKKSF